MKRILIAAVLAGLLLAVGCAPKWATVEDRDENVVKFTRPDTGNAVYVTLGPDLDYEKRVHRDFMGAEIDGYLYRAGDGTSVLVSCMDRGRFEGLIGRSIESSGKGIRAYPAQTSWLSGLCQLVRAYVVSLDGDVVAVVKFGPRPDGECDGSVSEEDYMAGHVDEVAEFDRRAERDIAFTW